MKSLSLIQQVFYSTTYFKQMSLSTHQTGQNSWEDDRRLANQEVHQSLHKSAVNYTFHDGPPVDCELSQKNPRSKFTTTRSILILSSCFRPTIPMHALSFSFFFFRQNLYAIDFVPLCTGFCFRRSKKKKNTQKQDIQLSLQYSSFGVTHPTQWNTAESMRSF